MHSGYLSARLLIMNSLAPADQPQKRIDKEDRLAFFDQVVGLIKDHGQERAAGDGMTVTFQPDGLTSIVCRAIHTFKKSQGLRIGVYADVTKTLYEWEDGSYVEHERHYGLPKWRTPYVADYFTEYDDEGNESINEFEKPKELASTDWQELNDRWEETIPAISQDVLGQHCFKEVMGLLGSLSIGDVVTSSDEVVSDY